MRTGAIRMAVALAGAGAIAGVAITQSPSAAKPASKPVIDLANPNYGDLHFETKLGSFKMQPKKDMAEGRVTLNFTGTVLLSNFTGSLEKAGDIHLEYKGLGREVYFGTGKIVATGRFRAIQWFGKNLSGSWRGDGLMRLYGEFDRDLKTGWYWYGDPMARKPWGSVGVQAEVPEKVQYGTGVPRIRRNPQ